MINIKFFNDFQSDLESFLCCLIELEKKFLACKQGTELYF